MIKISDKPQRHSELKIALPAPDRKPNQVKENRMRKLFSFFSLVIFALVIFGGCGIERAAIDPVGYKTIRQGEAISEKEAA